MLEEQLEELTLALRDNTVALQKLHDLKVGDIPAKKTVGELEQEMYAKQEMGDATTETPKKVAKKKASKKKAKKVEPEVAEEAEAEAEADPVVQSQPLDGKAVQAQLRGIASQLTDTSHLFALIQKHGAQQFSDLDPAVYPALIADAEQLVADAA